MAEEGRKLKGDIYHIRVRGRLDLRWADYFEGFVLASQENGETLLEGKVVDQAELHGVLGKIRDLGLPLLLVAQIDCPGPEKPCQRYCQCQECPTYHHAKDVLPL